MSNRNLVLLAWMFAAPTSALAGDVAAFLLNDSLKIVGSATADVVSIDQSGLGAGILRVSVGAGTTLHGGPGPVIFTGITKDVIVDLRNGADNFSVDTATFPRDLKLVDQDGAVFIALESSVITRNLTVKAGAGETIFTCIGGFEAYGDATFALGDGYNSLAADSDLTVGGELMYTGGDDRDSIFLEGSVGISQSCRFLLGDGENEFEGKSLSVNGDFRVECGDEEDAVTLFGVAVTGDALVKVGGGANLVSIEKAVFDTKLTIGGGNGMDTIILGGSFAQGAIRVAAGSGMNLFSLDQVTASAKLSFAGKGGVDMVSFGQLTAAKKVTLELGSGENSITHGGGSTLQALSVTAGSGSDSLNLHALAITADARFVLLGGNNNVDLSNATIGGDLFVRTSAGDDTFTLTGLAVTGKTTIQHGSGNDVGL
jgi:hypothetical protein